MKVKGYAQGELRDYVPMYNGNRSLPANEQIVVKILSPTEADKRTVFIRDAVLGETKVAEELRWQESVCRRSVKSLTCYEMRGKTIATGDDLLLYGDSALISELAAEVFTEMSLDELEKKISDASSDSSDPVTKASTGIVALAVHQVGAPSEVAILAQ
jgi:hypothetical protein